ncbi:MAG: hypothetical protein QG608_734 [Actinomycetota bacterium]|nr:hypothetical protein [Actinomycetota bacterium]
MRRTQAAAALAVVGFLLGALPSGPASAADGGSDPLQEAGVALPYGSTGWWYKQIPGTGGAVPEEPPQEAAIWSGGRAPFGSTAGPCTWNNPTQVKTLWAVNTDLVLVRDFRLPPNATNVRIMGTVDNDALIHVNDHIVPKVFSGSCQAGAINAVIPDASLNANGTNVVMIHASDHGVATYLDVQITYIVPLPDGDQDDAPTGDSTAH